MHIDFFSINIHEGSPDGHFFLCDFEIFFYISFVCGRVVFCRVSCTWMFSEDWGRFTGPAKTKTLFWRFREKENLKSLIKMIFCPAFSERC